MERSTNPAKTGDENYVNQNNHNNYNDCENNDSDDELDKNHIDEDFFYSSKKLALINFMNKRKEQ